MTRQGQRNGPPFPDMHRISDSKKKLQGQLTPATVWGTRTFVAFCVAAGIVMIGLGLLNGRLDPAGFLPFAGLLILLQWRNTFDDVAEQVLDTGDALLIKHKGKTKRVPVASLDHVEFSWRELSGTSQDVLPLINLAFRDAEGDQKDAAFIARTDGAFSASSQEARAQELVRNLRARVDNAASSTGISP